MSLIDREALYEKACDLEAQTLAYVGKIANDETRTEKWRIWSAILAERTAFKHDVFDAPEAQPEYRLDEWCTDCKEYDTEKHCCPRFNQVIRTTLNEMKSERKKGKWIRNDNNTWSCDQCRSWIPDEQHYYARYCLYCGARMTEDDV